MFPKVVQVVPMKDYTVYVYLEDGKIVCRAALSQNEYEERYSELTERYNTIKARYDRKWICNSADIRYNRNLQIGIEISHILWDLITVIFCYQISLKPLKTLSLLQVSFPLDFSLCYIVPYGFTNSDKGKNKGTRCPVDICSVPTEAAAETKKIL